MALTPEQRNVLAHILRVAKQKGASPKEVKAAVETGLVEANLSNPAGGDADSAGWRQERASLYKDPQNLDASIARFFNETAAVKGKYGRAGDLAAAVQRPAAQYRGRYQQRSGEAQALLGGGASYSPPPSRTTTKTVGAVDNSQGRKQLAAQFLLGGSNAQGQHNTTDVLGLALAAQGLRDQPGHRVTTPARAPLAASPGSGGFKVTGADPGRIKPSVLQFARAVSALYGKPLTGDSGATHSKMTVDGNVSQHYTGNATDIPASGTELIRLGRAALIAAGMPRAQALKAPGGLYNVGGHQVIFATNQGGNHYDHLHISAR